MRSISIGCVKLFFIVCLAVLLVTALSLPTVHAFMDNFEGEELGEEWVKGPMGEDVAWIVGDGELVFTGEGGPSRMMMGEAGWSDYTVECDIMFESLAEYPGGIRTYIDPNSGGHYAVWFYPDSRTMRLFSGIDWTIGGGIVELGAFSGISQDLEFFRVRVVHKGDNIEVWYGADKDNMKKVIEVENDTFGSGLFGFDGYNQPVHYDNFLITGPGIPSSAGEAVDSQGKLAATWGELKLR